MKVAFEGIERSIARGSNAVLAYDRATVSAQVEAHKVRKQPAGLNGALIGVKDNICTLITRRPVHPACSKATSRLTKPP